MAVELHDGLIRLGDASAMCDYSQDYLSLRARQGKLKAVKLGRNWATTKEWLQEYITRADTYKKQHEAQKDMSGARSFGFADPPANLPVFAPEADAWEAPTSAEIARRVAFWQKARFVTASAMVVAFLALSAGFGQAEISRVADRIGPAHFSFSETLAERIGQAGFSAGLAIEARRSEFVRAPFAAGVEETAQAYFTWFGEQVEKITGWFRPSGASQGLVVMPSTEQDEQVKDRIRQSFSDEVRVYPQDQNSGIITPVFRDHEGENYLYILVPLQGK